MTDLAYQIICLYDGLIHAVDTKGYTPLHLLADKPAVFRSGCRLGGFIGRIIYHCKTRLTITSLRKAPFFGAGFLVPLIYVYFEILLIMLYIYIFQGLNVEKLKVACPDYNFQPTCTDMHKHFSGDPEKDTEKYPENGRSINFFEPPLKMLQNMIKTPGG